ncbi:hypothetical protein Trydic_g1891 [Trypoxylus dichotomus]
MLARRQPDEHNNGALPLLKYGGGNMMAWGCFAGTKTGDLVNIAFLLRPSEETLLVTESPSLKTVKPVSDLRDNCASLPFPFKDGRNADVTGKKKIARTLSI